MKLIISLIIAFILPYLTCAIIGAFDLRIFDFVCGHNTYLQIPVIFFLSYFLLSFVPQLNKNNQDQKEKTN